jgi:hypothetical protein
MFFPLFSIVVYDHAKTHNGTTVYCVGAQEDQSLLRQLEGVAEEALGGRSWMARLDPDLLDNLGRYRKYRPASLRDLLRVVRNKHNHWRELPPALAAKLGPLPEGFLRCARCHSLDP